ncbi:immunoglobulin domain-containing protein [Acanthopleuribacter pedis]|uniref:Immunoglobulin domain-containing protein n=1 Tax=Acanthopleuribacter pedis TaxID=442870 RepID=A0A8J7U0T3_9BACT|nr:immunoglobulin domain-containing protein [Acanthopleuribacter pedis]MBO1316847.1 immunoglobulin domain-containing protein [Acanthopleuribacter pedis]
MSVLDIDRTGITSPATDLTNRVQTSSGTPDCSGSTMINSATEGQGTVLDFPQLTSNPVSFSFDNAGSGFPALRTLTVVNFAPFFTTVRDQETLVGILELPIAANPLAGELVIRAVTDAELSNGNIYGDGDFNAFGFNLDNARASITFTANPAIQTQPSNQLNRCTGDTVAFTVGSDTPGVTYQWQKDTVDIPGQTGTTLQLTNITAGDAGSYRCVVTNGCGSTTSNAASLTVLPGATIDLQPQNASGCEGQSASFSVSASGDGSITYQWRRNGSPLAGQTSSTLNLTGLAQGDEGSYDCQITSNCGTITSTAATLTVAALPTVTTHPSAEPGGYCEGGTLSLTVAGNTESSLSYQWLRGGSPIAGQTSATLTINGLSAGDAGDYSCRLTDSCGQVTSNATTVTLIDAVSITAVSGTVDACIGDSPTLSVTATGDGVLSYQWRLGGQNVAGATNATLTLTDIQLANAGSYTCVVTNDCGPVTSDPIVVNVQDGPAFSQQPQNQTECEGQSATFTVTASGQGTLTYQWRRNGATLAGQTSATLTLTGLTQGDEGNYDCVVGSDCGSSTSTAASLTVAAPPTVDTHPTADPAGYCPGGTANFTVAGITESSFTYQWLKEGAPIAGATAATLNLTDLAAEDAGSYSCRLTDDCGQVTSNAVTLTLNQPLTIDSITADTEACPGETASFTVSVSGDGPLTYQWRRNGQNLAGETSATISFDPVEGGDNGTYSCVVTGPCNSETSGDARLFSTFQADIITENTAQGLENITLRNSVFCGAPDFSYAWTALGNPTVLGTAATFTVDPAPQVTTTYVLTVTDAGSSQATDQVTIVVSPVSLDPNGDGRNDIEDLYFLIQEWVAGDLEFDADGDEELTILDILHHNWNIQVAR